MSRSILPSFLRSRESRLCRVAAPRRHLPPTPVIDRSEAEGLSLVELARAAEGAVR